jgi:hypothetical protein
VKHSAWEVNFFGFSYHWQNFQVASERNCDTCIKNVYEKWLEYFEGGKISSKIHGIFLQRCALLGCKCE